MKKGEMERLRESVFFEKVCGIAFAWHDFIHESEIHERCTDVYAELIEKKRVEWGVARIALEYITGKRYELVRDDDRVSIVNDDDHSDVLYCYSREEMRKIKAQWEAEKRGQA